MICTNENRCPAGVRKDAYCDGAELGSGATKSRWLSIFLAASPTHTTANTMNRTTAPQKNQGHMYFRGGAFSSGVFMWPHLRIDSPPGKGLNREMLKTGPYISPSQASYISWFVKKGVSPRLLANPDEPRR